MKKYLFGVMKRVIGAVVLFLGVFVMFIPFVLVHVFLGLESANKMMDRIAIYYINTFE